jgi:hypothetical protein
MPRCVPLVSSAFDVPLFPIEVKSTVLLRQDPSRGKVRTLNAKRRVETSRRPSDEESLIGLEAVDVLAKSIAYSRPLRFFGGRGG